MSAATGPPLVLGGGPGQLPFLRRLRRRVGAFTLFDRDPAAPGRALAAAFATVSIHDAEACLVRIQQLPAPPSRVLTFATGAAGEVVCRLNRSLGLPSRSPSLARAVADKQALARRLGRAGLARAAQLRLPPGCDDGWLDRNAGVLATLFPAVIKPVHGGGGRDVRIVPGIPELRDQLARQPLERPALLQRRIVGRERLVGVVVRGGRADTVVLGDNLFDADSGWPWPIGVVLHRLPALDTGPDWLPGLLRGAIAAFELVDDFIVIEAIVDPAGVPWIIDVELNALAPFACAEIVDGGGLTEALLDAYLVGDPACAVLPGDASTASVSSALAAGAGTERTGWSAALIHLIGSDADQVREASRQDTTTRSEGLNVRLSGTSRIQRLHAFDHEAFQGGYLVLHGNGVTAEALAHQARHQRRRLLAAPAVLPASR